MGIGSVLGLGGCANDTPTGAGLGAAVGSAIHSRSGDFGWGALVGAGFGVSEDYIHDHNRRGD